MSDPSTRLVHQRIRNRVIEYLELASSYADQTEYQRNVPIANVVHEVINQWEDWVNRDPTEIDWAPGVFSEEELVVMTSFHDTWETVIARTRGVNTLTEAHETVAWADLRAAAAAARMVFEHRGQMSEDIEEQS